MPSNMNGETGEFLKLHADIEHASPPDIELLDTGRYPRSPVVVTKETAKAIDMSGIMRMTPEQIDELLAAETGRAA